MNRKTIKEEEERQKNNSLIEIENIQKEAPREYDIWLFFLIFAYNMRNLWYDYRS